MENKHRKKKAAVVVITVLMALYYLFFFFVVAYEVESMAGKIALGTVPLILGIILICVANERIKEIEGGEEDDLSKY